MSHEQRNLRAVDEHPGSGWEPVTERLVCRVADLSDEEARAFRVGAEEIVLCLLDAHVSAFSGNCTHEDLPLDGGSVENGVLTCPWHGAQYDARTGQVLALPAVRPIRRYPCRVDDVGAVFVDLDD